MNNKQLIWGGALLTAGTIAYLNSRKTTPMGVEPVMGFDMEKYLGKWYEIARLDDHFERGLSDVTAEYSFNEDGTIRVINRGYDDEEDEYRESEGKAKFAAGEDVGQLKVSFLRPFYSGYHVVAVDPDYRYALVAGKNLNYLWLLSRDTTMPEDVKENYLQKAEEAGYDLSRLVWVTHRQEVEQ